MPPGSKSVLAKLERWLADAPLQGAFADAFIFGSLVYLEGLQFDPDVSDVDLLLEFAPQTASPAARVAACIALLPAKQEIERILCAEMSRPESAPLISVVPMSRFEIENGVHKDGKPGFFRSGKFVSLLTATDRRAHLGGHHVDSFLTRFAYAVQPLRDAQKRRNEFLSITANGGLPQKPYEGKDALPKDLCRSCASLRFFAEKDREDATADINLGHQYFLTLLHDTGTREPTLRRVEDLILARANRGKKTPIPPEDVLLLWEILASAAMNAISDSLQRAGEPPSWRVPADTSGVASMVSQEDTALEELFLTQAALPSLRIGALDLACKIFPPDIWERDSSPLLFEDDPEAEAQVEIVSSGRALPSGLLGHLLSEMDARISTLAATQDPTAIAERKMLKSIADKLRDEGSNAYPRMVAPPWITLRTVAARQVPVLQIRTGPSRYGIELVAERHLDLPTAILLRSRHILNGLAVRIAYVAPIGSRWWMEFHQRDPERNATYRAACDIGAAGYVDPVNHLDPEDRSRVSPWQAAAHELSEELGIEQYELPHRDKYAFFW